MAINWAKFAEFVEPAQRFLLTTHIRPDGDGLGSMLALADALGARGKETRCVISSSMPARYQFLDEPHRIERFDLSVIRSFVPDRIIILDTGTWNQLGDVGLFLRGFGGARAVVDHHQTQDDLGAIQFVDTNAEATGRLVYEATKALGPPITPHMANHLFVAIAMDTGWFRHQNTSAQTFSLAADLLRAGANPGLLYERLFEDNTLPRLRLMGLVLERLQVTAGGGIGHTEVRLLDYATTGAAPQDTEDMVNFTRSIAGVEVGLFFLEQPQGGTKVSFRSRLTIDVARIAERFGGGGHRLAAGAVVDLPLEQAREQVLEVVRAALGAA